MKAVDYHIDCLADTPKKYDRSGSKCVVKLSKRMAAQVNPHTVNPFHLISTIVFAKILKLVYDSNGVHKGTAM